MGVDETIPALICVGVDLAWSSRNNTGIAVLRWHSEQQTAELIDCYLAVTDDDILAAISPFDAGNIVVAIDAPLNVPNREGRRLGDAAISAAFGKFKAGAYPANRRLLANHLGEQVRGEVLVQRLADELGIRHCAEIVPRQPVRQTFEVFPHPAMVALFGLERILPYKAKTGRSLTTRLAAFADYHHLIDERLASHEPALRANARLLQLLSDVPIGIALSTLKRHEDQLDALICAYVGLYYWYWGTARCHIFGSFAEGYIIAPVDSRIPLLR